jgi:hypothetical protein
VGKPREDRDSGEPGATEQASFGDEYAFSKVGICSPRTCRWLIDIPLSKEKKNQVSARTRAKVQSLPERCCQTL